MTECLARTFVGEIPRVPSTTTKNTCLIALWLLSLQLQLFTASKQCDTYKTSHPCPCAFRGEACCKSSFFEGHGLVQDHGCTISLRSLI